MVKHYLSCHTHAMRTVEEQEVDHAFFEERKEQAPFSPPLEVMKGMLDDIPDGFVYTDGRGELYINKAAQETWGVHAESYDLPFDTEDPATLGIIAFFSTLSFHEPTSSTHFVHSIDKNGNRIPTRVTITRTPERTTTIQITDVTVEQFAEGVRHALHKLNNVSATIIGGADLMRELHNPAGEEILFEGIDELSALTHDIKPLQEQARSIQEVHTSMPSHISHPLSFPAS